MSQVAGRRRLVILSVPFVRLARVSLSELVLGVLRERHDVVIVAPFAEAPAFQEAFAGPHTSFLAWKMPRLRLPSRILLAASELMRRNGYYRRYRDEGMAYYVHNELTEFGMNGADRPLSPRRAAAFRMFGQLGRKPGAWRAVDTVLGSSWCRFPALETLAAGYDDVTIVQSANWGDQDRALSRLSRTHGWRRVLLPYTNDQLDVNGYLLNEFDAICAQGPFEVQRARTLHGVPGDRVIEAGSAWLRHLDLLRAQLATEQATPFMMYAGASALYFPRESEFEGLELSARLAAERAPGLRVIYRPVPDDDAARAEIEQRCSRLPNVSIQWPAITEIGLEGYSAIDHHEALRSYVRGIRGCRGMVMSNITSLAIDIARVSRCGIVSNQVDPRGMLDRRRNDLLDRPWLRAVRIARTRDALVTAIEALLDDPELGARDADRLNAEWDFPHQEFETRFLGAVEGVNDARAHAPS